MSFLFSSPVLAGQRPLRMGFVPGKSPHEIINSYYALIRHVIAETKIPIEIVIMENYQDLVEAMENGDIDILEGSPYTQAVLFEKKASLPLVGETKFGSASYKSIIAVHKDSNIKTIEDLKNKSVVFMGELSTSGYILPRLFFHENGYGNLNDFFSDIFLSGGHDRSIELLLDKRVDAAALGDFFIKYAPIDVRNQIRIVHSSDPFPISPISYHPKLDKAIVEKLRAAFLNISKTVAYETLRHAEIDGFTIFSDEDYQKLVELPKRARNLDKIKFSTPINTIPDEYQKQKDYYRRYSLQYMAIPTALLILILVFVSFLHNKKSIRKYFLLSVSAPVMVLLIFTTAIEIIYLNSTIDRSIESSLERIRHFESEMGQVIVDDQMPKQVLVEQLVQEDETIEALRLFRNGHYVADSTKLSLGRSIVDNVLANAFSLLPANEKDFVEVINPIWIKDKIWGRSQVLISFVPLKRIINRAVLVHSGILGMILLVGSLLYFFFNRVLGQQIGELASVLEKVSGKKSSLKPDRDNLVELAKEFDVVSSDIAEKNVFLNLKSEEMHHWMDISDFPHMSSELYDKLETLIHELENKHPEFKRLRQTELLGNSPSFLRTLMDTIIRSKDNSPVYIYGPTGSGKTGIAKAVHFLSPRRDQSFGEFNCAEFASGDPLVVLGKLFGYGKNSGIQGIPKEGQKGLLEQYDSGTLFLDEVEIIPAQTQRLLLLPLEGRPFNPAAGMGEAKRVDVRFIFASNIPVKEMFEKGMMRQDFFRRASGHGTIYLAPLRERKEDIIPLALHFLRQWNEANQQNYCFEQSFLDQLTKMTFDHFNVSELKTFITVAADRALFAGIGSVKTLDSLPVGAAFARLKPDQKYSLMLDAEELNELQILKQCGFNILQAEKLLGYATGAKTLSNHFRGICYKFISLHCQNSQVLDENIFSEIARQLVDQENHGHLVPKVSNKIKRFFDKVKLAKIQGETEKLTNNLPKKYHEFLEKILS